MKAGIFKIVVVVLTVLLFSGQQSLFAQTAGTLTFSVNAVSHNGSYGSKHLVAIWLENASGTFVKTKMRQCSTKNLDHLGTWTAKSNSNVVDATTGATLTSYSPITVTWNGTDVSGTVVPDGNYKIWIELAWDDSKTTGKTVTSYSFTKGIGSFSLTPANTALFTNVSINWLPSTTDFDQKKLSEELLVYPNPAKGMVYVSLKSVPEGSKLQVVNANGVVLFEERIMNETSEIRKLDFSGYSKGIYMVSVVNGANIIQQSKLVLDR